jgi:hypothetical protein
MVVYFRDISKPGWPIDLQGRLYKLKKLSYEESLHYNKRIVGLLQQDTHVQRRDKVLLRLFSEDEVASWYLLEVLE